MAARPIVVYAESPSDSMLDFGNPYREGLAYFLTNDCDCDLQLYDHPSELKDNVDYLRGLLVAGRLLLVIVKQSEYSDSHKRALQFIRSRLSRTCPVVVIPDGYEDRFQPRAKDRTTFAYDHTEPALAELVRCLRREWKPAQTWSGAETVEDQAILRSQLEHAYRTHYLEQEDGVLAVPDHEGQVVAEALRLRLLPAACLKSEFDDTLVRRPRDLPAVTATVYQEDLAKLRAMTDAERDAFEEYLLREEGYVPYPGGGVQKVRASLGWNVQGFAIDPVTFESLTTDGFGMHANAKMFLAQRIEVIDALQRGRDRFDLETDERAGSSGRIVTGLIYRGVKGFSTPVVRLGMGWPDEEDLRRVARYLIGQQQLIPITMRGNPIEG